MNATQHDIKRIAISPESRNYNDNDENVAYLYRGYFVWKYTNEHGPRGGRSHEWHFGPATFTEPDVALGDDYEPYWDDCGPPNGVGWGETRKDCIARIDQIEDSKS